MKLSQLLPGWAVALIKSTINWSISNVDPAFRIFTNTAFTAIQNHSRVSCNHGKVKILDTPRHIPKARIRNKPLFETFELETALILAAGASATNLRGPVDYEIEMKGDTYPNHRQTGPAGVAGSSTGTVQATDQFRVTWR
jgi:hypothetical protein